MDQVRVEHHGGCAENRWTRVVRYEVMGIHRQLVVIDVAKTTIAETAWIALGAVRRQLGIHVCGWKTGLHSA
ncbi:hypothetical protein ACGE24_00040 [Corynebacterium kroppenstedtii]|uniref:hypothetical protein n=1 Tax=Corynebacterium sp. PCR 32 TaxID=3351342 RepID=UPI0030A8B9A1